MIGGEDSERVIKGGMELVKVAERQKEEREKTEMELVAPYESRYFFFFSSSTRAKSELWHKGMSGPNNETI